MSETTVHASVPGPTLGPDWEPVGDRMPADLDGPRLLVGTRKGRLDAGGRRRTAAWAISGPTFLGHIIQHIVLDPRDRIDDADGDQDRAPRPDRVPVDRRRAHVDRGRQAAGVPRRRRLRAQRSHRVLAGARPRRRARRLVRRRLAAGPVPVDRRRRHLGAGRRLERPSELGDVGRVARRRGHARRLDAALDPRRPARS